MISRLGVLLSLYTILHRNICNVKSLCILDSLTFSLYNFYFSRACGLKGIYKYLLNCFGLLTSENRDARVIFSNYFLMRSWISYLAENFAGFKTWPRKERKFRSKFVSYREHRYGKAAKLSVKSWPCFLKCHVILYNLCYHAYQLKLEFQIPVISICDHLKIYMHDHKQWARYYKNGVLKDGPEVEEFFPRWPKHQKGTCVQLRQTGVSLVLTQTHQVSTPFFVYTQLTCTRIDLNESQIRKPVFLQSSLRITTSRCLNKGGALVSHNDNSVIWCFKAPNQKYLFCTKAKRREKSYPIYVFNRFVSIFCVGFSKLLVYLHFPWTTGVYISDFD